MCAQPKVLVDGELGKDAAAFGDVRDALPDDVFSVPAPQRAAGEPDVAQPADAAGDGPQCGCLAGSVGAEQIPPSGTDSVTPCRTDVCP